MDRADPVLFSDNHRKNCTGLDFRKSGPYRSVSNPIQPENRPACSLAECRLKWLPKGFSIILLTLKDLADTKLCHSEFRNPVEWIGNTPMSYTRRTELERKTSETAVRVQLDIDGTGQRSISTGIPFFDHMLNLFAAHGLFDLSLAAQGDIEIDFHHTVEDVGLCLGEAFSNALGDRKAICRYGHAVVPMDEALAEVTIDLSNRPFWHFDFPERLEYIGAFPAALAKEWLRAFATRCGMNLHVTIRYGENDHHIIEAVFKALGRALSQAVTLNPRITGVPSTKGSL
jgi:imidazoleglycerol-phosphate dehydratase